jgi:hypothetical protein
VRLGEHVLDRSGLHGHLPSQRRSAHGFWQARTKSRQATTRRGLQAGGVTLGDDTIGNVHRGRVVGEVDALLAVVQLAA